MSVSGSAARVNGESILNVDKITLVCKVDGMNERDDVCV